MQLIDIHAHNIRKDGHRRITDCGVTPSKEFPCSVGLHPWYISADWQEQLQKIAEAAGRHSVAAIGECGLDTLKSSTPIERQTTILLEQIKISEATHKPLILHTVKTHHLLLKIAKETPHAEAWIVHGFRGGAAQALQLTSAGLYLSFGARFNEAALKATPLERIFVESDESQEPLEEIYNRIAAVKGCSPQELITQINTNTAHCNIHL